MVDISGFATNTRLLCGDCNETFDEHDAGPALYECQCGNVFNKDEGEGRGHGCPECHKFASKVASFSCPECGQGSETEEVPVWTCEECEEEFQTEEEAEEHWAIEHEVYDDLEEDEEDEEDED